MPRSNILRPKTQWCSYLDTCHHEKLKASYPHFVFLGHGVGDCTMRVYTNESYIDSYVQFIKEIQALPTKPTIILLTPSWSFHIKDPLPADKPKEWEFSGYMMKITEYPDENRCDIPGATYKIAEKTGIPANHVLDFYSLFANPKHGKRSDFF